MRGKSRIKIVEVGIFLRDFSGISAAIIIHFQLDINRFHMGFPSLSRFAIIRTTVRIGVVPGYDQLAAFHHFFWYRKNNLRQNSLTSLQHLPYLLNLLCQQSAAFIDKFWLDVRTVVISQDKRVGVLYGLLALGRQICLASSP